MWMSTRPGGFVMDIGRLLERVMLSALAGLVAAACAGPGETRVEGGKPSSPPAQSVPSGEALVFGKMNLVRDGTEVKIRRITTFGPSGIAALVLPDDASTAFALDMDEQGWFAWRLKPGAYSLLGFVSQDGNKTQFLDVEAGFTVDNGDAAVYIGHINVHSSGARYTAGIQDSESEAIEEIGKKHQGAGLPVKRLARRADKIGAYAGMRSVCDAKWGLQCARDLHGVSPIHPAVTRGIHGSTFGKVDAVAPTLKWAPAAIGVSYDVAIWEAAAYRLPSKMASDYTRGRLALYEENLIAPELTLSKPLKARTKYFWSVRCRDGDVVSSWSRAGHFTFLLVAWTSGYGEWFAFETP